MKQKHSIIQFSRGCLICGNPNTERHHLIYGNANRQLSDQDGLYVELCKKHHTGGADSVHLNPTIAKWSRIAGEMAWINTYCQGMSMEQGIAQFRARYGKNYL